MSDLKTKTLQKKLAIKSVNTITRLYQIYHQNKSNLSTANYQSSSILFTNKNVSFKAINQNIDTTTSTGKLMLGMLSIIAEFENDLRRERQSEGIIKAKQLGKFNKEKSLTPNQVEEIIELQKTNLTNQMIADKYNVGRSTLLKYVSEFKKNKTF